MGESKRRTILDRVEEARASVPSLTVSELERELAAGGDVLLVDIRDVRERWREGTIPGARSAPRGMLEFWADPESPYHRDEFRLDRRTVLYCAGGMRSALAAQALIELGFENVAHLDEGFGGWVKEGRPVDPVPVPEGLGPAKSAG